MAENAENSDLSLCIALKSRVNLSGMHRFKNSVANLNTFINSK